MAEETGPGRASTRITYTRIYADEAGCSHVGEGSIDLGATEYVQSAPAFDLSDPLDPVTFRFATLPVGWVSDWHPAPRRQFFLQLSGVIETEMPDGQMCRTGPGSVTLIEDVGGKGHRTRVLGETPVVGGFVQLG
jgi:hypothetical protein